MLNASTFTYDLNATHIVLKMAQALWGILEALQPAVLWEVIQLVDNEHVQMEANALCMLVEAFCKLLVVQQAILVCVCTLHQVCYLFPTQ